MIMKAAIFAGNEVFHCQLELFTCPVSYIKTHDSESRGQEEAAVRDE